MLGAALLAACGNGGGADEAQARTSPASARRLDVAGVRPGMSAQETQGILQQQGWKVDAIRDQSWDEMVEYEVRRQRNDAPDLSRRTGIGSLEASKGDERLEVRMHPVSGGAQVSAVNYVSPLAGRSYDQIRAQMVQRYGEPDRGSPAGAPVDLTYCSGGVRCTNAFGSPKTALSVGVQSGINLRINLLEGVEAERAWRASLDRAVASKMGGGGKSF
jgi:hypothetical protein